MNASPTTAPCVCNLSGHCASCLAAGVRCERAGCRATRSDGVSCASLTAAAPARRAPAMPVPELVEEPRVATTSTGLEDALRASLVPGWASRPAATFAAARSLTARASSASRPGRALSIDDLDAHERARFSAVQPRALDARTVSSSRARGAA